MSIQETAISLLRIRSEIERLEAEKEKLQDTIKAAMVEAGKETLSGEGWKASWKNVTSSRFDSKAFKAAHADLYGAFCKPQTTVRFTITA